MRQGQSVYDEFAIRNQLKQWDVLSSLETINIRNLYGCLNVYKNVFKHQMCN